MQRDLTSNSAANTSRDYFDLPDRPDDPFRSADDPPNPELVTPSDSQSFMSEQPSPNRFELMYPQDYGYSQSHLLVRPEYMEGDYPANDNSLPKVASQNDEIHTPPIYHQYPLNASSRPASSNTLNSHLFNGYPPQHRGEDLNGLSPNLSKEYSSPFLSTVYYSPFGGYPASSFPLHIDEKEDDDYLHNPDPIADTEYDKNRFIHDLKSLDRHSMLGILMIGFIFLLLIGVGLVLPVITFFGLLDPQKEYTYEVLTQYNYPISAAIRTSLIDPDTPPEARWKMNNRGENWTLTFSDEFNAEGRTFYEGDDQFFQAVDLHYDATKDLEWYDPDAVTTANGTLLITMDAIKNHDLFYRSGMVQSWNKLCFTQGMIEISANLPNYGDISGLWPGMWTMGNLARPGYLATSEGVWPYTYDSCDAGITANQSSPDGISYLPGQRLNVCTCKGEDHPNRGTARGAPEIDILEGSVDTNLGDGVVSQALQVAPFDIWYTPDYNFVEIYNLKVTAMNAWTGTQFQQAISGISTVNTMWYEYGDNAGKYQSYGFEYLHDNSKGYITWYVGQEPTFTMHAYALGPNGNIGFRRVPKEPMTIIMNMGMSKSWAYIDWAAINFPCHMRVSYVRIYQPPKAISMTCDPSDYPTTQYINDHLNAYMNVNLTSWSMAGYEFPRNKLVHNC